MASPVNVRNIRVAQALKVEANDEATRAALVAMGVVLDCHGDDYEPDEQGWFIDLAWDSERLDSIIGQWVVVERCQPVDGDGEPDPECDWTEPVAQDFSAARFASEWEVAT